MARNQQPPSAGHRSAADALLNEASGQARRHMRLAFPAASGPYWGFGGRGRPKTQATGTETAATEARRPRRPQPAEGSRLHTPLPARPRQLGRAEAHHRGCPPKGWLPSPAKAAPQTRAATMRRTASGGGRDESSSHDEGDESSRGERPPWATSRPSLHGASRLVAGGLAHRRERQRRGLWAIAEMRRRPHEPQIAVAAAQPWPQGWDDRGLAVPCPLSPTAFQTRRTQHDTAVPC